MPNIVPIVEGPGEFDAFPVLLRKILWSRNRFDISISHAKNAHGLSNLTCEGGIERFLQLALCEPECGAVLVLVDADNKCPVELAKVLIDRVSKRNPSKSVIICVAKCEYESWFLASLPSIAGQLLNGRVGLPNGLVYAGDPENLVGVKGWLTRSLPGKGRSYKETEDQLPMTVLLDIELASRSRSFRRLLNGVSQAVLAIDNGITVVTPER